MDKNFCYTKLGDLVISKSGELLVITPDGGFQLPTADDRFPLSYRVEDHGVFLYKDEFGALTVKIWWEPK